MYKVYVAGILDKRVSSIFPSSSISGKAPLYPTLKEYLVWEANLILAINCSL